MNILVIGAGWYGCHLSKKLIEKGHNVKIIDKENDFFSGSSSKNQNRLHLGFHYPRCDDTIDECISGYFKFLEEYKFLTNDIKNNMYFISKKNSLISIKDFKNKFEKKFKDNKNKLYSIHNIEDDILSLSIENVENVYFNVNEKYINFVKAKDYFKTILKNNMIYNNINISENNNIFKNNEYDYIINCTYNHLSPITYNKYENYMTLLYQIKSDELFAYTIMDGPFFSIYPYDISNNIYTVTSVKHGVLYEGHHLVEPENNIELINEKKNIIENELKEYIPTWDKIASYVDYYQSWKTKPKTINDDRSLRFEKNGNNLHFYGGKITGIYHAEEILKDLNIL